MKKTEEKIIFSKITPKLLLAVIEGSNKENIRMVGFNIEASSPIADFKLPNGLEILEIIVTKSEEIVIIGTINEIAIAIWVKLIVGVTRELGVEKLEGIKCPIFASRNRYSNTEFSILSKCKGQNDNSNVHFL